MNLKEAINEMKRGTKHYKLIVVNQEDKNSINECESLDNEGILRIDVTKTLTEEILVGKDPEDIEFDTWDYIKDYLHSLNFNILILNNVDYMFSPDLGNLDAISNFKYYSRNGHIIVLFIKGKLIGNYLFYSKEGYPDYKRMDVSEVLVVGW